MLKTLSLAFTALFLAIAPATAQVYYGDAGYTFISIDEEGLEVELGTISARGGLEFTENFGVEIEGAIGVQDESVGGVDLSLNYLVGAYGKAQAYVSDTATVYARAGIVNAELETSGNGFTLSQSETGAGFGAGAVLELSNNLYLRGDYTRYEIEELGANAFTLSLGMRF